MPSPTTTGSSNIDKFQRSDVDVGLRRIASGSALPKLPQSGSRGLPFRGFHGSPICYGLPVCLPPCPDLTGFLQPSGTFTSGLPAGRSPFPPPDMTTTATGLLVWGQFCQGGAPRG